MIITKPEGDATRAIRFSQVVVFPRLSWSWFGASETRVFGTRIESGIIGERYFITSEQQDDDKSRKFTVRSFDDKGAVDLDANLFPAPSVPLVCSARTRSGFSGFLLPLGVGVLIYEPRRKDDYENPGIQDD